MKDMKDFDYADYSNPNVDRSKIDNRSEKQLLFDYSRNVFSTLFTFCCIGVICYSIGKGYATMEGPAPVLYIVLVCVLTLLGYLEGLQVAILALERIDSEPWKHRTKAYQNH